MTITDPFIIIDEDIGFNATVYPNPFINNASIRIASLFEDKPVTVGTSDDAYKTMELVYKIYVADAEWRDRYGITVD
ncbi:MAG: hypothetical protein COB59_08370 [Rhodospirillaceae bacterium]|nr:MAG: hypothetical protein COB59_08370 [Rhodospirillaceae bacterium]